MLLHNCHRINELSPNFIKRMIWSSICLVTLWLAGCAKEYTGSLFPIHQKDGTITLGYMDKTGKIVIKQPLFKGIGKFSEGLACVMIDNKWGYINKTGKYVVKSQFVEAWSFTEGLAAVKIGGENGKWGFIDKTGQIVISPQFDWAGVFSEELATIIIDYKRGYINKIGQIVIIPQFDEVSGFSEGLSGVKIVGKDGKWGYINKTGQIVITPQFDTADKFSGGLASVRIGNNLQTAKYGYIDKTGKYIWGPTE
jgi:hypothetical protein